MLLDSFDSTLNSVKQHDFPLADKIVTLRPAEPRFSKDILMVPLPYQASLGQFAIYEWTDEQGYHNHLQTLNQLLTGFDLHFGYRVFDEIAQFMAIANKGNLFDNLNTAFDLAVLMKVLPKFNGPRSRLRLPLETVVAWAKNPLTPTLTDITSAVKDADSCHTLLAQLPAEYSYPETARKALRMLIRLHETGFASFA